MQIKHPSNAGVNTAKIKFCDLHCEFAKFPEEGALDGSKSCRTYLALWCVQLKEYVTKNAPCAVKFGKRRPKCNW